jgi:hypothetical protein
LKKIGLAELKMDELRELIKPEHLQFVSKMLGVELEEPSPISAPLSGGQNSVESSSNS